MSPARPSIIVSPNSDRAAFPRREPLAAVEPLGISPLSSATTWQPHASPGHWPGLTWGRPVGTEPHRMVALRLTRIERD